MIRQAKKKELKKIAKTHGITHEQSKREREKAKTRTYKIGPSGDAISLDSSHEVLTEEELKEESKTQRVLSSIITMYQKEP